MRVEKATAVKAAQAGPRNQRVAIRKDVASDLLFSARTLALLAAELTVERVQGLQLRCQFIDVAFHGLSRYLWVERNKVHWVSLGVVR
jgi:hypothetical protein